MNLSTKLSTIIILLFVVLTSTISAQSTIIKLPTDTDASNFQIQNNSGTTLFLTKGDALFEMNGLPFLTRDDDNNGQLVLRRKSNANQQILIGFHSSDYGFIQTLEQTVGYRNLYMNPAGGNIGIGALSAGEKLTVAGKIHSTSGGFKFPDGTEQTTAAVTGTSYWTASSNNIYNNNSGNVGLGISTLTAKLHVAGDNDVDGQLVLQRAGNTNQQILFGYHSGGYGFIQPVEQTVDYKNLYLNTYGGNVGIGGTTASQKLEIIGNSIVKGTDGYDLAGERAYYYIGDVNAYISSVNGSGLLFGAYGAADGLSFMQSTGNVGIGTTDPQQKLEVAGTIHSTSGGFKFPDGSTQATAAVTGTSYWTASSNDIYNSNSGNLGIGTSAPVSKLDVKGTTLIRGDGATWRTERDVVVFGQYDDVNPLGNRRHKIVSRIDNLDVNTTGSGNYLGFEVHDGDAADGSTFAVPMVLYGSTSVGIAGNLTASGIGSVGIGFLSRSESNYGFAAGFDARVYSDDPGSFVFNDGSGTTLTSSDPNEWVASFSGGYRFYSNTAHNLGANMPANQNGWGSVSDSTKKENHLKADGEYFLNSISKLKLGSWNYKGQDSKTLRHYGPMAQEIFHYFGQDGIGTIGCDTLLLGPDMDGIIMIALKALEKRTAELKVENNELRNQIKEIVVANENIKELEAKYARLEELLEGFVNTNSIKTVNNNPK